MQTSGNDYIYFDNRDGSITSPESLAIRVCDRTAASAATASC